MSGKLVIVGFGPGSHDHLTYRAKSAITESEVVIGYNTYVDLVRDLLAGQTIIRTGMTEEVSRAQKAVELALGGANVAVISSGDAGVYGMAGLVYEVLIARGWRTGDAPEVEVVPGISAMQSCASLLGAPIMHDACTISLSDHLTPWSVIEGRIEAAARSDFVIALYNPRSGRRTRQIAMTQQILLQHRSPDTPVGLVKSAWRARQEIVKTTLSEMLQYDIGMLTTVIIGNSSTFYHGSLMITPRGYQRKYTLDRAEQPLRPGDRLQPEHEPWALASVASGNLTAAALLVVGGAEEQTLRVESTLPVVATSSQCLRAVAREALDKVLRARTLAQPVMADESGQRASVSVLEVAVSPGVANKKFSSEQMLLLATLAGEDGDLEYTTAHHLILRMKMATHESVVERLNASRLFVSPVGNVVKIKACDFCNGEKSEGIPFAEVISDSLAGLSVERELRIGFNGCAMACYGAVNEDIGVVFCKGKFDLFLGGKTTGRNAGPGQRVAKDIPAEQMGDLLQSIVTSYRDHAFPGERFHKFFARVGELGGFVHEAHQPAVEADTICGS